MKITGAYGGANYSLSSVQVDRSKALKQLSSGKRINGAADDAAGLAISEKLEAQSKEYATKVRGIQNEISYNQVSDSGLDSIGESIQRLRELAIQAKNDTLTDSDKAIIQEEAKGILEDINLTSSMTEFNTKKTIEDFNSEGLSLDGFDITSENAIKLIDDAQAKVLDKRGTVGAKSNSLEKEVNVLQVAYENSVAANSRIEDADMLLAMMDNTKGRILEEANFAVNAQSRLSQERILDILSE